MDNSYYTGATLIRGSHHHSHPHCHNIGHGHSPYHQQQQQQQAQQQQQQQHQHQQQTGGNNGPKTPLAGPPLLMQPRNNKNHLFSGAPLIRNGPQQVVGLGQGGCGNHIVPVSPTLPNQPSPHPSSVICCFQPVYYVPMQQNPSIHQLNSPPPPSSLAPQQQQPLALLPPPIKKMSQQQQSQGPKRRNYKSLQIPSNKMQQQQIKSSTMNVDPRQNFSQSTLPNPSPVGKKPNHQGDQREELNRHVNNNSPVENIYCNGSPTSSSSSSSSSGISSSDEIDAAIPTIEAATITNDHTTMSSLPFQTCIESSRLSNEEKQHSDNLLNFYFYDAHWRPKEIEPPHTLATTTTTTTTSTLLNQSSNHFDYNNNDLNSNGSNMETSNDFDFDWGNNNSMPMTSFGNYPTGNDHNSHHRQGPGIIGTKLLSPTATSTNYSYGGSNSGINNESPSVSTTATMVVKKKDLEIDAQIVTLANGHRDLEIRLLYVTS